MAYDGGQKHYCKGYLLYKFCCVLYPYYGYLHREQPTWTEDGYDKTYGMLSFVDSIDFFRTTDTPFNVGEGNARHCKITHYILL
jgi:hypothetical protein